MSEKMNVAVSDHNLKTIDQKDYEKMIEAAIIAETNLMVIGRRGTGKTEIPKRIIGEMGFIEQYLNASTMERPDIGGYPRLFDASKEGDFVKFVFPDFYKGLMTSKERKYVLFLDEVDKADPSIWAPLLEITQFKTINGIPLTGLKAVIMTGNMISEGGQKPIPPLLDRAIKFKLEASYHAFLDHCGKYKLLHPSIGAFLEEHPDKLVGEEDSGDLYADPSPRSWVLASKILSAMEKKHFDNRYIVKAVSGSVGKKISIEFENYFTFYQDLKPLIDRILTEGGTIGVKQEYKNLESPSSKLVVNFMVASKIAVILDEIIENQKELKELGRKNQKIDTIKGRNPSFLPKDCGPHLFSNKHTVALLNNVAEFFSARNVVSLEHAAAACKSQITKERMQKSMLLKLNSNWTALAKDIIKEATDIEIK